MDVDKIHIAIVHGLGFLTLCDTDTLPIDAVRNLPIYFQVNTIKSNRLVCFSPEPSLVSSAAASYTPTYGIQVEWKEAEFEQSPIHGYMVTLLWKPVPASATTPVDGSAPLFFRKREHKLDSAGQRLLTITDAPVDATVLVLVASWYTNTTGEVVTGPPLQAGVLATVHTKGRASFDLAS